MKLVAIGYLGHFTVYVGLSREEAVRRHEREHPGDTVEAAGLAVQEIEVKDGKFGVYDIWEE